MNTELIIALIGIASTIIGSWASYFFTRKKYNSEVENTIIENMKQSLDFYTKLSDDNRTRLTAALKQNEILDEEVRDLRRQVNELMMSICYDLTCSARQKLPRMKQQRKSDEKH